MAAKKKAAKKAAAPKVEQPKGEVNPEAMFRGLDKGGLFGGVPAELYHSDPLPKPSVSSHFLGVLDSKSPRHAWIGHPRLNPAYKRRPSTDEQDFGSAAHAAVLGAGKPRIIDARNFQTDIAKTARAQARLNGEIPILKSKWETIQEMKRVLFADLESVDSPIANVFDPKYGGRPEVMAAWQEDGVWCRALADWWIDPRNGVMFAPDGMIVDYKTTWQSAAGEDWSRSMYGLNGDLQPVWYPHGFNMAMRESGRESVPVREPRFLFIVQEAFEPFASEVFELSDVAKEHARNKIIGAFNRASACLQTGEWPKYQRRIFRIDPPAWQLRDAEMRRLQGDVMNKGV